MVGFFYFYCFLGTLDRFSGDDRMKALHFLGIFMFALRWYNIFGSTSGPGE